MRVDVGECRRLNHCDLTTALERNWGLSPNTKKEKKKPGTGRNGAPMGGTRLSRKDSSIPERTKKKGNREEESSGIRKGKQIISKSVSKKGG